jgi:hypothetical protein
LIPFSFHLGCCLAELSEEVERLKEKCQQSTDDMTAVTKSLQAKEEQIAAIMTEGEQWAKNQASLEGVIKKQRAKLQEKEVTETYSLFDSYSAPNP